MIKMEQKKLFEKDEDDDGKEKTTNQAKSPEPVTTVENTTYHKPFGAKYGIPDEDEIPDTEGFLIAEITLLAKSTLDEQKYGFSVDRRKEMPAGFLGSMWGSGSVHELRNDINNIKEIFKNLMEEKKESIQQKYIDIENLDYEKEVLTDLNHHFRFVPAKNYFVAIPDKLRTMLKEKGFNFEEWYEKYQSLEGKKATNKDVEKALEHIEIKEKADIVQDQIRGLNGLKSELDYSINHKNKKAKDAGVSPCFENLDTKVDEKMMEKVKKLNELVKKMETIEKDVGIPTKTRSYRYTIKRHSQTKITSA